jgi:UDP-N-acetylmuramoylalanine--D-glutamate ligase
MFTRELIDFRGKRVTVMGLGLFGGALEMTKYLVSQGADVTATDLKSQDDLRESVKALEGIPVRLRLGGHDEADFTETDVVIVNPDISLESPYIRAASDSGVLLETEMNLIFKMCPSPIIGITGSSGKTTTTTLIGEMVKRAYPGALVGGNIGGSLIGQVSRLEKTTPVVLELSSFQLQNLGYIGLSPHIAVVTNISPNHLDRHGTMEEYIAAKKHIISHQKESDTAILNYDDPVLKGWKSEVRGELVFFSLRSQIGDGAFVRDDIVYFGRALGSPYEVFDLRDFKLLGNHNIENALAAAAAATSYGVDEKIIAEVLRNFRGVEHRLELVRELDGVRYYNDSIATSPDRTIAALNCFSGGIVLIAGGYDKKLPFDRLSEVIAAKVKHLILIGQTMPKIAKLVSEKHSATILHRCSALSEAVNKAREVSRPGDVVLLSPASASYDMFRNFEERGRLFKKWVWELY